MNAAAVPPCGTYAAVSRHKRRREPLDDACRRANADYQASRREKNPSAALAESRADNAYVRALRRLGREYPERLRELHQEELRRDAERGR